MSYSIRVDRIPGGVWPGAPCEVLLHPDHGWLPGIRLDPERPALPAYAVREEGQGTMLVQDSATHSVRVRLTDPLGLGLAGLVARVARRLGVPTKRGVLSAVSLVTWIGDSQHRHLLLDTIESYSETIVRISTHICLTDRLCAAVGLEREGHEVAMWDSTAPMDDPYNDSILWELKTPEWHMHFADYEALHPSPDHRYVPNITDDDWLPALEAALDSVEGS